MICTKCQLRDMIKNCERVTHHKNKLCQIITFWDHFYGKLFSNKSWAPDILCTSCQCVIINASEDDVFANISKSSIQCGYEAIFCHSDMWPFEKCSHNKCSLTRHNEMLQIVLRQLTLSQKPKGNIRKNSVKHQT